MTNQVTVEQLPVVLQSFMRTWAPHLKTVKLQEQNEPVLVMQPLYEPEGYENVARRFAVNVAGDNTIEAGLRQRRGSDGVKAWHLDPALGPWFVVDLVPKSYGSGKPLYAVVHTQKGTIEQPKVKVISPLAYYLYILTHIPAGGHYRADAFAALDQMFGSKGWRDVAYDEGSARGLLTAQGREGKRIIGITPAGKAIGSRIPDSYNPRWYSGQKPQPDFFGSLSGGNVGAVSNKFPGYVPRDAFVTVVDEGSFTRAHLANAGIEPVRAAIADGDMTKESLKAGTSPTQPLGFEDYEAKASMCQALKGGGNPPCRVQLTSIDGGDSMAVRLCDKIGEPGTVIAVKDAHEALKRSREFCKCARNKPASTRKKCARKTAGAS